MVMSNEYKEWLKDRAVEVLFENEVIDRSEDIYLEQDEIVVWGIKDGRRVIYRVWFDDIEDWSYRTIE